MQAERKHLRQAAVAKAEAELVPGQKCLALHNFPLLPCPKLSIVEGQSVHALPLDLQKLVLCCRCSETNPAALHHHGQSLQQVQGSSRVRNVCLDECKRDKIARFLLLGMSSVRPQPVHVFPGSKAGICNPSTAGSSDVQIRTCLTTSSGAG